MLKLKNVEISYKDIQVIWGIDLEIKKNEIVVVIGQNGAGKSTLLSGIMGLLKLKSGEIFYKNNKINNLKTMDIVKQGITLVPEGSDIFPKMNVLDNLLIGSYSLSDKTEKERLLTEVFELFPVLKERTTQLASTLSGGEKQMLAIGRALMSNPDLILLDEPSLGLQPLFVKKIFEIILKLKKLGKTILLVEQNVNLSLDICDKGYVIENGKVVLHGKCQELKKNDYVKKAYLGI